MDKKKGKAAKPPAKEKKRSKTELKKESFEQTLLETSRLFQGWKSTGFPKQPVLPLVGSGKAGGGIKKCIAFPWELPEPSSSPSRSKKAAKIKLTPGDARYAVLLAMYCAARFRPQRLRPNEYDPNLAWKVKALCLASEKFVNNTDGTFLYKLDSGYVQRGEKGDAWTKARSLEHWGWVARFHRIAFNANRSMDFGYAQYCLTPFGARVADYLFQHHGTFSDLLERMLGSGVYRGHPRSIQHLMRPAVGGAAPQGSADASAPAAEADDDFGDGDFDGADDDDGDVADDNDDDIVVIDESDGEIEEGDSDMRPSGSDVRSGASRSQSLNAAARNSVILLSDDDDDDGDDDEVGDDEHCDDDEVGDDEHWADASAAAPASANGKSSLSRISSNCTGNRTSGTTTIVLSDDDDDVNSLARQVAPSMVRKLGAPDVSGRGKVSGSAFNEHNESSSTSRNDRRAVDAAAATTVSGVKRLRVEASMSAASIPRSNSSSSSSAAAAARSDAVRARPSSRVDAPAVRPDEVCFW